MPKIVTATLAIILLLPFSFRTEAQEDFRFDAGAGIGMTGYLGDANTSNLWSSPGFAFQGVFRYIANPRWNFKTGLYIGSLNGDSSKMTNIFPSGETYKFSTTFFELSELAEFNFFNYGMGETYRHLKRWTPYITGGLGATLWSTSSQTSAAFTIPFGAGVRYKPSLRVNLGLEFLMKKVFSDRLDGPLLDDPLTIESAFEKNTDWYSTLTLTVTYEFGKRCAACNYKD